MRRAAGVAAGGAAAAALALGASAADSSIVAEFNASGFVFKDTVEVSAIPDPKAPGVTLYLSDYRRSLTAKLQKDFFNEPSSASLACVADGPIAIPPGSDLGGRDGQELFAERKNMNLLQNKTLRVRRILDRENDSLIYVAYATRTGSGEEDGVTAGRYKTSLCAVPLNTRALAAAAAAAVADP